MRIIALTLLLMPLTGCVSILDATTPSKLEEHNGTRTLGAVIEDENIETKVSVNLRKSSEELKNANIDVVSYNGIILLTGEVPDLKTKEQAAEIASSTRAAKKVHNELNISGVSSWISRVNDMWITTKVSTAMSTTENLPSSRIKVVTEQGTVYLMGLVTDIEGEHAVSVTKEVYGVEKIVTLFEKI